MPRRSGSVSGASRECGAFPWGESHSSNDSAAASARPLFAGFAGTTDSSDFLSACLSAFSSMTFSDRSPRLVGKKPLAPGGNKQDLPVLALEVSQACTGSATPPCRSFAGQITQTGVLPSQATTRSAHGSGDFGAQWLACLNLWPMRHLPCDHGRRTVRGRGGWLSLPRRTLAFPTPSRLIPALSMAPFVSQEIR